MRSVSIALAVALLAGCAPAEEAAEQAGPTLADFAGTWEITTTLEGVEDPVTSTMSGSADGSGWVMMLEGRDPIPMQVSVVGDSLIGETAEYESILRDGVMVSLRTASVLSNAMMQGAVVATYTVPDGQELVVGTFTGTRMQEH